ncbi:MAG: hypothetical protein FWE47_01035 [Oscillospiraceae bacterium]|nr:hypothetical protein [Oscillospiraceae bacterium]
MSKITNEKEMWEKLKAINEIIKTGGLPENATRIEKTIKGFVYYTEGKADRISYLEGLSSKLEKEYSLFSSKDNGGCIPELTNETFEIVDDLCDYCYEQGIIKKPSIPLKEAKQREQLDIDYHARAKEMITTFAEELAHPLLNGSQLPSGAAFELGSNGLAFSPSKTGKVYKLEVLDPSWLRGLDEFPKDPYIILVSGGNKSINMKEFAKEADKATNKVMFDMYYEMKNEYEKVMDKNKMKDKGFLPQ